MVDSRRKRRNRCSARSCLSQRTSAGSPAHACTTTDGDLPTIWEPFRPLRGRRLRGVFDRHPTRKEVIRQPLRYGCHMRKSRSCVSHSKQFARVKGSPGVTPTGTCSGYTSLWLGAQHTTTQCTALHFLLRCGQRSAASADGYGRSKLYKRIVTARPVLCICCKRPARTATANLGKAHSG